MHRREERDERRDLGRAQVLAVRRHVAAALQDLPDQLVARESRRDVVERRPAQAALAAERVAVAALLALHQQRALQLERRAALEVLRRRRARAPRVHHRRPRRERAEPGERADGEEA